MDGIREANNKGWLFSLMQSSRSYLRCDQDSAIEVVDGAVDGVVD